MTTTQNSPTLVLGGTGKTGSQVAQRLTARGVPVRIGSRSGDPPFDWEDRRTWPAVLADVSAVYVAYVPDVGFPGASDAVTDFTRLAREHGVERVVLLSGRGEPEAQRCEAAVQHSGLEWTVVQASFFAQNFDEGFLADAVRGGLLAFPAGDVPEPFIDVEDIADVAAAALTEPGHAYELYEVTGPRLLSFADVAAELTASTGRAIHYLPITPEEFRAALVAEGEEPEVASLVAALFTDIMDGRNAYLGDGVRRALGREPRDFGDFARSAAATGVWEQADMARRA